MRRLLAAAAVTAALLAGTGCSADGSGATQPSAGATVRPTSASGDASPAPGGTVSPAGGNAKAVCAAATKASAEAGTRYVSELGKMLQAGAADDTKGAKAAQQAAERALNTWAAQLKEQSGKASDARLKSLLNEMGTAVGRMKADIESIDEMQLDLMQQRLDQLCAG